MKISDLETVCRLHAEREILAVELEAAKKAGISIEIRMPSSMPVTGLRPTGRISDQAMTQAIRRPVLADLKRRIAENAKALEALGVEF